MSSLVIHFFSVRDAFNDGRDKLHPAFCILDTTFVLTRTRPRETLFVKVDPSLIDGLHLKATSRSYLTTSYKKNPQRFNNNPAGQLTLSESITNFIRKFQPDVNLEEYCFKIFSQPNTVKMIVTDFPKIREAIDAAYGSTKFTTDDELRTLLCLPAKVGGKEVSPSEMIVNMAAWAKRPKEDFAKNPALLARIHGGEIEGAPVRGFIPAMAELFFQAGSMNFALNTRDGQEDAFIAAVTEEKEVFTDLYVQYVMDGNASSIMKNYGQYFEASAEEVKAAVEAALSAEATETPLIINEEVADANATDEGDASETAPDADAPAESEDAQVVPTDTPGDEVVFADSAVTAAVLQYIGEGMREDMEMANLLNAVEGIAARAQGIIRKRQEKAQGLIEVYLKKASHTAQLFIFAAEQAAALPANVEVPAEPAAAE